MSKLMLNSRCYSGGGGGNSNDMELTYAEYDALTEEEKTNGTNYFITDINGDGSQFRPVIYSTEEREIGVWTDGKPLYQKTYHFSITSSGQSITVAQNLNYIDTLVKMTGIAGNQTMFPQGSRGSCSEQIWMNLTNNTITVFVGSGSDVKTGASHVTIQYTKTTDAAGSGTWTPQGVPAVHYSTNEQVVGTWIDGRTIYEKTFHTRTVGTSTSIDISDLNAEHAWVIDGYWVLSGTDLPLNSAVTNGIYCHACTRLTPPRIDFANPMESNIEVYATIRYIKIIT